MAETRRARSRLQDFYGLEPRSSATSPGHAPEELPVSSNPAANTALATSTAFQEESPSNGVGYFPSVDGSPSEYTQPWSQQLGPAASTASRDEPLDLNGNVFQAEKFTSQLLVERNLKALLETQCALLGEIKTIDTDMKTLVYENYEKFISATDTIKKMKSNVESMETEMTKLADQITKITEKSSQLTGSFSERRAHLRDYGSRHNLLKKLQFIFDLPSRLKQCAKRQQYADAVRYHFRTQALFQHYRDILIFQELEKECAEIMKGIGEHVRQQFYLQDDSSDDMSVRSMEELSKCVQSLLALGEDPVPLAKTYLQTCTKRLREFKQAAIEHKVQRVAQPETVVRAELETKSLTTVQAVSGKASVADDLDLLDSADALGPPKIPKKDAPTAVQTSPAIPSKDSPPTTTSSEPPAVQPPLAPTEPFKDDMISKARYLNETFLRGLCFLLDSYYDIFLNEKHRKTLQKPKVVWADANSSGSSGKGGKIFAVYLSGGDYKEAKKEIDECMRTLIHEFFTTMEGFLFQKTETMDRNTNVIILDMLFRDLTLAAETSAIVRSVLQSRAVNLIGVFLNRIIHDQFKAVQGDFMRRLLNMHEFIPPSQEEDEGSKIGQFVEETEQWLRDHAMRKCIQELQTFSECGLPFMHAFSQPFQDGVKMELKMFWMSMLDEMMKQSQMLQFRIELPPLGTQQQQQNHARSILLLVMSRLATCFRSSTIVDIFRDVLEQTKITTPEPAGPEDSQALALAGKPGRLDAGWMMNMSQNALALSQNLVYYQQEIDEVSRKCKQISQALVLRFVESAANEMSMMIRRSLESRNWILMKEPRKVSKLWEQVMEDMNLLDRDLVSLYAKVPDVPVPREGRNTVGASKEGDLKESNNSIAGRKSLSPSAAPLSFGGSHQSMFSRNSSILDRAAASIASGSAFGMATSSLVGRIGGAIQQNFMNNLDKLFSERQEIYPKSIHPETRNAILQAIIRILLKTFVEVTRLRTLGKSGFQQIQVDVEYARLQFWKFMADEKLLNQMLDEVMASAEQRCLEPAVMEYSVVEKILSLDLGTPGGGVGGA